MFRLSSRKRQVLDISGTDRRPSSLADRGPRLMAQRRPLARAIAPAASVDGASGPIRSILLPALLGSGGGGSSGAAVPGASLCARDRAFVGAPRDVHSRRVLCIERIAFR